MSRTLWPLKCQNSEPTPSLLTAHRPMMSSSSGATNPMPRGLQVLRPQRSRGRGQGSQEGHCLSQRRRRNPRRLIKPKTRRTLSLVKNAAGKMSPRGPGHHVGYRCAAGIGAPWVWLLIGSVGFQGNDITGQAWFEGGEAPFQVRGGKVGTKWTC